MPEPPRPSSAPATPTTAGSPVPTVAAGWVEHEIGHGDLALALPAGWLAIPEADLADPERRAALEADFEGASALFGRLDAQGRRARLVFLGVDARARGTGRFAPNVSVAAVEPALPPLLLGIGADFTVDALGDTFAIETDIERSSLETPIGDGIRITFSHRAVGPAGGAGTLVEHDGAIVTTGDATILVSRNVEVASAPADTPTLDEILATLRPIR